jgi:hypothetical protein
MHVGGWCAWVSTPGNYGLGIEPESVSHVDITIHSSR